MPHLLSTGKKLYAQAEEALRKILRYQVSLKDGQVTTACPCRLPGARAGLPGMNPDDGFQGRLKIAFWWGPRRGSSVRARGWVDRIERRGLVLAGADISRRGVRPGRRHRGRQEDG